jgi:hypothetical protein
VCHSHVQCYYGGMKQYETSMFSDSEGEKSLFFNLFRIENKNSGDGNHSSRLRRETARPGGTHSHIDSIFAHIGVFKLQDLVIVTNARVIVLLLGILSLLSLSLRLPNIPNVILGTELHILIVQVSRYPRDIDTRVIIHRIMKLWKPWLMANRML